MVWYFGNHWVLGRQSGFITAVFIGWTELSAGDDFENQKSTNSEYDVLDLGGYCRF